MVRFSDRKVSSWFLSLSDALKSGFSPADAVRLAGSLPNNVRSRLIQRMESGSTWREAVENEGAFLEPAERLMISAAEQSGNLPKTFEELGEFRKEAAAFKSRIFLAALYPLAILHLGALLFPVDYLVDGNPKAYAVGVGMVIVPLWIVFIVTNLAFRVSPRFKKVVQSIIPIIRGYSINRDLARFCRVLASCIRSGVPLARSWEWSLLAADSLRLDSDGYRAIDSINRGSPASNGFSEKSGFPPELIQQYAIGEKTGELDVNMSRVADMYSSAAKKKLFIATLVYPQILFLIIAAFVALKVIGFYKGYFDNIMNFT
jgi:type IV pilus assembly protein PilC